MKANGILFLMLATLGLNGSLWTGVGEDSGGRRGGTCSAGDRQVGEILGQLTALDPASPPAYAQELFARAFDMGEAIVGPIAEALPTLAPARRVLLFRVLSALRGQAAPALGALCSLYATSPPEERLNLILTFRDIAALDDRAYALLLDAAVDPDASVRVPALAALEVVGRADAATRKALERATSFPDENSQSFLARAAYRLWPESEFAVERVRALVDGKEAAHVESGLGLAARERVRPGALLPRAGALLTSSSWRVRLAALEVVAAHAQLAARYRPAVEKLTTDANKHVAKKATEVLRGL